MLIPFSTTLGTLPNPKLRIRQGSPPYSEVLTTAQIRINIPTPKITSEKIEKKIRG